MWKKLAALAVGLWVGYYLVDDFNPESVRGKNVLVTGASTGIGEQIAYHYARLGANVVITARRENRLKQVNRAVEHHLLPIHLKTSYASDIVVAGTPIHAFLEFLLPALPQLGDLLRTVWIKNRLHTVCSLVLDLHCPIRGCFLQNVISKCRELAGPNQTFHYVVADMLVLNATSIVVQKTIKLLGGLDYLVLNHIALQEIGRWQGSSDNFTLANKVLTINFQSYIYLASYSLPHLKKSRGSIVVVNSLAGKMGQPFLAMYSASKFALDGFFSGLRQELLLQNCDIAITSCVIGFIRTENCISQLQRYGQDHMVNTLQASSPSDAALAIIKGGASRAKEIYFPYMEMRPVVALRDWFPSTLEYMIRSVYTADAFP